MNGVTPKDVTPNRGEQLVVGVDGHEDSLAALRWAASVAGTTGTVHAVLAIRAVDPEGVASPDDWVGGLRDGGVNVVCHRIAASAADAIWQVAQQVGASLVAVGSHGQFLRRPRMVGSVVHRLLQDCELPVVVVRAGTVTSVEPGTTMTVGIGHGAATAAAIEWAGGFAATHGLRIDLVHVAEHRPLVLPSLSVEAAIDKAAEHLDPQLWHDWAEEDLDKVAAQIRQNPTADGVPIEQKVVVGSTGPELVKAATHLLVVGKHFDGPMTGYFTTEALHHVLTHASVPVVVVPQTHTVD